MYRANIILIIKRFKLFVCNSGYGAKDNAHKANAQIALRNEKTSLRVE